jgi:hypothetical protein
MLVEQQFLYRKCVEAKYVEQEQRLEAKVSKAYSNES